MMASANFVAPKHVKRFRFCVCSIFVLSMFWSPSLSAQESLPVVVRLSDGANTVSLYKKSYALVIGISDYGGLWPRLNSALTDAQLVKATLQAQGFEVRDLYDLTFPKLDAAFRDFFLEAGQDEDARLPSTNSTLGYSSDAERAAASAKYFGALLELARRSVSRDSKVHIVAHGTGIRPVLEAVDRAALASSEGLAGIGEIIAAAPDISAVDFERNCRTIKSWVRGITVYASGADQALKVAEMLNQSVRAGQVTTDGPAVTDCAEVIDVSSSASAFAANHVVYATSHLVLRDIAQLLSSSLRPPTQRSTQMREFRTKSGNTFWRLGP
jgi:Alpha/beta hydrolase of unknown function (DUF900)/Caspase domain